jgi:hypothetical protein
MELSGKYNSALRCKTSLNIREEQIFQLIDKFNCLKICSILPFASNQVSAFVDSDHVNFVLIPNIPATYSCS